MDSCAILVAAGGSGEGDPYGELFPSLGNRIISSNFGSIIDTWAWGDSIMSAIARVDSTTGAKTLVAGGSSETSGASAVIAGAILLMQQLRQSRGLQPLQYPDLRTHFANPLLGTVGVGDLSAVVMPDLAKLEPVIAPPQQPPIN